MSANFKALEAIEEASWAEALRRDQALRPLAERDGPVSRLEVGEVAERLGISERWTFTLIKRLRAARRTSTLARNTGGRPVGLRTLDPQVDAILEAQIQQFFGSTQKPSKLKLFEAIKRECRLSGLKPPCNETVRRRLKESDPVALTAARLGRKTARDRHGPVRALYAPSDRPLGLVQIDHTRVDLIVVDEVYREPIGRPWLTVAIDVFSRVVAGYYLTFEAPSALSVAMCMAHLASDKALWLAALCVEAEWPGGLPEGIHLDNASEFHADALVRGCEEHGIIVNYRPVATPHYGGHVERLIGTTMGEVHLLPGTTFSNVAEKGKYDSAGQAALTLAELDVWLARQIAVLYHGSPHRGLGGRTPLGVWREAVEKGLAPRAVADPEKVRIEFLPSEHRRPRRDGVELFRLAYWHDALPMLAARSDAKMLVRYDPRDMSRVWLRAPGEREHLELRLKDLSRPSVTLWEWRAAGKRLRAQGRREVDEDAQFRALEANRKLVAEARDKTSRRRVETIATARKGSAPTSAKEASRPVDYTQPAKIYDVEQW